MKKIVLAVSLMCSPLFGFEPSIPEYYDARLDGLICEVEEQEEMLIDYPDESELRWLVFEVIPTSTNILDALDTHS